MLAKLHPLDKVSIVALAKKITDTEKTATIAELSKKLNISLSSEHRNRQTVADRLYTSEIPKVATKIQEFAKDLIETLLEQSFAKQVNHRRASYAPWFKAAIAKIKSNYPTLTYDDLEKLLGISKDTLVGFKIESSPSHTDIDPLSKSIAEIWNNTPPKNRQTIDDFRHYLDKKHGRIEISYHKLRQTLIELGFYSPRGPKIKNHGSVKKAFDPHGIWEGDAKQMNIYINGTLHTFSWYAFTDQNTTLLVGSNIESTETTENFLKALQNAKRNAGVYAVGILIDNRLSDSDLSPINEFMKNHNITLIRTFPGNAKSNGIIEGNFSIFERFVGDIFINGQNEAEIAKSMAQNIATIFTQLRNNRPRKRLRGATPNERAENSKRPEHQKSAVDKLAARINGQIIDIEDKWQLIESARLYFEPLSKAAEEKIKWQLKFFPTQTIIAAQAAFISQKRSHPENSYSSAYFMAILRSKQETRAKQIYNEEFRSGIIKASISLPQTQPDVVLVEELLKAQEKPSPTQKLLHLEAIAWTLVNYHASSSLTNLWQKLQDRAATTRTLSYRFWQKANEYLTERLENLLYCEANCVE